ncbi:Rv3235 family protein [Nocardioides sp. Kera G14]|uniref:Rv3235 family protein n=1 Tax=Nocardioides sp. Kera G14 TaxID=2884264 RepID=UPI001D124E0F|nr:Rv3235 family protein [Nocardioides sp. Kera G14]UDY24539.1 Rv3235 family protein [Nocardioides sp. Kera G14]
MSVVSLPAVPVASVQGTLALALEPRRAVPTRRPERAGAGADVIEIGRTARRELELWATRFTQAAVEIVGGDRPSSQLVRWCVPSVFEDLKRRAELVGRAGGHRPGEGRVAAVHPRVVGVHTCFVTDEIVEAGLHVRYGHRSRAIAARFERRNDRWLCTALDFS